MAHSPIHVFPVEGDSPRAIQDDACFYYDPVVNYLCIHSMFCRIPNRPITFT